MTPKVKSRSVVKRVRSRVIRQLAVPPTRAITRHQVQRLAEMGEQFAPIFIIGAPRTGSTILYQALTDYYRVLYIDNLAAEWSGSLLAGMRLSSLLFGDAPHASFEAIHGNTDRGGLHAPSECGDFWYRWVPRSQHFVGNEDVTPQMVHELRKEVHAIQNHFRGPLLFKNLNVGQRLTWISEALPSSRFIWTRREPADTVRSILKARHTLGIPSTEWWSTRPRGYTELIGLPENEMVAKQVDGIEREIETGLSAFPEGQVRVVEFAHLSTQTVHRLGNDWLGLPRRAGGKLPVFRSAPQGGR